MAPSSGLQPARLDFGGLDLNSTSEWEDSEGPPPVRVPSRSGRGTLGSRGERGLAGSAFQGGGTAQGGGGSTHVGGGAPFLGPSFAAAAGGSAFMGGHTPGGPYAFMAGQAAAVGGGYGPYGVQAAAMATGGGPFVGQAAGVAGGFGPYGGGAAPVAGGFGAYGVQAAPVAGGAGAYGGYVPPTPNAGASAAGASRGGRRRNARRRVGADMDRGKWTDPLIKQFCEIYCAVMDTGNHNCLRGKMTARGWEEVSNRFQLATSIYHDSEQFGYLLRKLKKKWNFIDKKLRKGFGLGRGDATTVQANDHWWEQNAGTDTDLLTLRDGLPDYVDEMDKMFTGFVADGSTSYAPGQGTVHNIPSDDDEAREAEEGDDEDVGTPVSVGSKRTISSRSTGSLRSSGSSPQKSLRTAVTTMGEKFDGLTAAIRDSRVYFNDAISQRSALKEAARQAAQRAAEQKRKEEEAQMDRVIKLAKECGFTEDSPEWIGVLNILNDEKATAWFLKNGIPGRIATIKNYANRVQHPAASLADNTNGNEEWDEDDESDEEFEQLLLAAFEQEQAIAAAALYGMNTVAMHVDKYCTRSEPRFVGPGLSGLDWVARNLANTQDCYDMYRMSPNLFYKLHDLLVHHYGLTFTGKSCTKEALGLFLWVVGAPQSVRQARNIFQRSLGTVHNLFYKVLTCLVKLADDIIKPRDPDFRTMHPRLSNRRFYPYFKDCIGAIDGTHIPCVVSQDLVNQYMCRKNITTQNVMACCDFDLIFTFVNAGWPGSVHDMRVFDDAMDKWGHVFPHPPQGKFYLVDSGYPNRPGYLAPYKTTRYHLEEFRNAEEPQGKEEFFNYAHSSLRNCIERSFGVLKHKFRILMGIPSYPLETQTHIVVACMALHNFIRLSQESDRDFASCDRDPNYVPAASSVEQPRTEEVPVALDSRQMNEFRDTIALQMFLDVQ